MTLPKNKLDLTTAMQKPSAIVVAAPTTPAAAKPSYREDRTNVTVYLEPAAKKRLKLLGVERGHTIHRMVAEALNDFFAKNGVPECVPIDEPSSKGSRP